MRPIGTASELQRRRTRAVGLMSRGESPAVVARLLGVRRTSLYRWKRMAQTAPEGLAARPHPGPGPRLTAEQLRGLETRLRQGATAHGWPNALWTARRVAEMIPRHFAIAYQVERARKILRERLGRSSQEPRAKARQRDVEVIDH